MSYQDGMAALRLQTPDRVPRTEYSAEGHWALIKAVTGIDVSQSSPDAERRRASLAFMRAWNYDLSWQIDIAAAEFGDVVTKMGHANYAAENADYSRDVRSYFHTTDEVLDFDPVNVLPNYTHSQLVKRFNDSYAARRAEMPFLVNMNGTYVTAVSGMIDLFGWDLLLNAAGDDSDRFGEVVTRYSDWMMKYYEALADCDSPVIMVHDDIVWTSGPFIQPAWYRQYVFPAYKRYFAPLHEAGKLIIFTSDGTYTTFIDDIADCGVNCFVMEPTTDMAYIAEKYGKTHAFIGNADTRVLLSGSRDDIEREVRRCMDIGKKCPGFFMAVGNHIPSNTPVENALWYNECYEKYSRR